MASIWTFCVYLAVKIGSSIDQYAQTPANLLLCLRTCSAVGALTPFVIWIVYNAIIQDQVSLLHQAKRSWWLLTFSLILAVLCFCESFIPSEQVPAYPKRGIAYYAYCVSLTSIVAALLFRGLKTQRKATGIKRIELQFFVINISAACVLIIVLSATGHIFHLSFLRRLGPIIYLSLNGVLAWALVYHRIFDARQWMFTIGQRIMLLTVLGVGAFEFSRIFVYILPQSLTQILGAVVAGVVVYYFDLLTRRWLGLDPDLQLSEPRAKIIAWARTEANPEKLRTLFEEFLRERFNIEDAELLAAREMDMELCRGKLAAIGLKSWCRQGWITPEYLQRLRPDQPILETLNWMARSGTAALIAVPPGSDAPSLIMLLGPRQSLRPFTYPDITLLVRIAELMDNILSHARLSANAARLSRLESAAMMSRGLAHDLNNLTTPVSSYLMHRDGLDPPDSAEADVHRAATRSISVMQEYIRESLFFSRQLVPEFKTATVERVVWAALDTAAARAGDKQVRLATCLGPGLSFTVDPALIQRLLVNLIHNAIDASSERATVEIAAGLAIDDRVYLSVSDSGTGIADEHLARIFEPYFTTKDTGEQVRGLGLGLAICRKIADLHQGEIEVRTALGSGTVFKVVLPRNSGASPIASNTNNSVASCP